MNIDAPIFLNRAARRSKKLRAKFDQPPMPLEDLGPCYYCSKPVYASSGQAIRHKVVTTGKTVDNYPTHKKCRKVLS